MPQSMAQSSQSRAALRAGANSRRAILSRSEVGTGLEKAMRWIAVVLVLMGVPVAARPPIALAIHGGAGTMARADLSAEREAAIRRDLAAALDAGYALLEDGGSALDAVTAAVVMLEDSPHFNAGKGAVFTADGRVELDASIMDGSGRRAGAVAGLTRIRNPIRLARAVMERSPHVMMIGEGAERFAQEVGIDFVDPEYFKTDDRWQQYLKAKATADAPRASLPASRYLGTVGAVALDANGGLAAATSTGGMMLKRYGRVGDVPIIGAGTFADERCAVSATGWGEFFIRLNVAADICARVAYGKASVGDAADEVVLKRVPALGGNGGVIAIDAKGRVRMPFNTDGMYRAAIDRQGKRTVEIFR
jgi:beta-aspartyl-peptidase (threonine type)